MSLYGMMKTGVSGMNAQANRLSTVSDNIANSGTTGYKRASTEFSSMVVGSNSGSYNSGGVTTSVRYAISDQGLLNYTTSKSDLAIQGDGFFVVQDAGGQPYLTRAGAFVLNSEGNLVNSAGYQLMGYSYANGQPTPVANGYAGLEPVTINELGMETVPSTAGSFAGNLPANTAVGDTRSKSLSYVDKLGNRQLLDVEFTKTADNQWDVSVGGQAPVSFTFDPGTDQLTDQATYTVTLPDNQSIDIDFSMSQMGDEFTTQEGEINGSEPSTIDSIHISEDGIVSAQYENGSLRQLYRVPLASVPSPDQLRVLSGNIFAESIDSGDVRIGFAEEGGNGKVISGALEGSNVDIAEELTTMIESQRTYTANSKSFQTGSELMELLVNLKR
ncbi:flagellar hook protein FlgE [Chelativorans sp. YIM 93263]|uniref:flagellar hook protein FlgE n=1 Tax=Chelativorans sp. YIM 93263 TaxID=2906648 RepID=UPI002378F4DC|nr:flagellar hook protein FlgE [Chelativorans sp. YIM 93263]